MTMSERLAPTPEMGPMLSLEGPGEFRCDDCGARCTRGPDGVEYGHARGHTGVTELCPRRPGERVDPVPPSERGERFGGGRA